MTDRPDVTHMPLLPLSRAALAGFTLGLFAVVLLAVAGPGMQLHWWSMRAGSDLFRVALWLAIGGGAASILGVLRALPGRNRRGAALAVLGVILALLTVAISLYWLRNESARSTPPDHALVYENQ